MTIAVTGASGHVGANLVRILLERGETVRALVHRDTRAIDGLAVERVAGEITDEESLVRLFDGCELVYHLAGHITLLGQRDQLESVNGDGPAVVARAARRAGVRRLVHTSSIEALLNRAAPRPLVEDPAPAVDTVENPYGRSKARGERAVLAEVERGLDAVIVNPTAIIGPYDFKPSLFGQMFIDFARRKLPALVTGGFDLIDVRDICAGMIAAAERGRTGQRYLLAGEFVEIPELARMLEEITGARRPRFTVPMWLAAPVSVFTPPFYALTGGRPRFTRMSLFLLMGNYRVDAAKARAELGHAPRPVAQAVEDAVRWFRDHGAIPPA